MLPDKPVYEVIDAIELAQRSRVHVTWIREQRCQVPSSNLHVVPVHGLTMASDTRGAEFPLGCLLMDSTS